MGFVNKSKISKLNSHLGYWLRFVSNHVSHSFALKLTKNDVTVAEWVILREMYEYEEAVSPSKIVKSTGLTKGAISKLITRLIDKKLVLCKQSPEDQRQQTVELTNKAITLVPKLAQSADENDKEFFACLNTNERKELLQILEKLVSKNKLKTIPAK